MTPLAKARQILTLVEDFAAANSIDLPTKRYAQLGEVVIDCESVIVAAPGLEPSLDTPPGCGPPQLSTFQVLIIRACAFVAYDDGTTNKDAIESASESADADGQMLWDFADAFVPYVSKEWSLTWTLAEAGLAASILSLTTGID